MIKMIICNGNKIHYLDYDVIGHWIHLKSLSFMINQCFVEGMWRQQKQSVTDR